MENKILICGCVPTHDLVTSNGTTKPTCRHGVTEFMDHLPDLTGREAKCVYCGSLVNSDLKLAFFEYKQFEQLDSFYCGCFGWE